MVSTYNEPLITSEWAVAVFKEAKAAGLLTGYVSNGNGTPEVLEYIRPWVDLYKVDLKSFDDRHYRQLGGRLQPILDTIRRLHAMGFWVEIVTLLIPGFNDSRDEIARLTEFVAGVSPDIPWHVTAFHGDYKMTDPGNTTADMLLGAAEIGRDAGLRYVYAGNLPGRGRGSGEHALRVVRRDARRALRVFHPRLSPHGGRLLPHMREADSRPMGAAIRRPNHVAAITARIPLAAVGRVIIQADAAARYLQAVRCGISGCR